MNKDEFIDQLYDKLVAYRKDHGKAPSVICIPFEIEKAIAKFADTPLLESVRETYPTINSCKVEWDAQEFEFRVEAAKTMTDPPDQKQWSTTKF